MTRGFSRNMLLPAFIVMALLGFSITLLTIVARSPYTHSNLDAAFDPNYSRTDQILVGPSIPMSGGMLAVPRASDPVALGKQLFVADGCAACHGLDGRGGVIGPSIVGTRATKLRSKTNSGPKGMPAYASGALSDEDLKAIEAYLNAMGK